jgi:(p)ppGpp synthase/HD superfamily hydrolase
MKNKETQTATLEDAIAIAALAHKGQRDKAGSSYVLHPLRMMMKMKSEKAMMVAVLHDVVEDSKEWTFEGLREKGFSEEVIAALDCVTNRPGEDYGDFIKRVQTNPIACEVKIADLEDNMNIQRINQITPRDLERLEKYHKYWSLLTKTNI